MKNFLEDLKYFLEKADSYRDKFFLRFVKPHWPNIIYPNHITWIRVILGVLLFILIFWLKIEDKTLIISLFCIGAFTDLIDGPVARGTDRVTEFGAMLDSTADRILIIPIAFYSLFYAHRWLLLILILVEISNLIASLFYQSKEAYLQSNIFGKTKMVMQSIVFIAILFVWPKNPSQIFIYILWLTIPFSVLSILTKISKIYPSKLKVI